MITVLLLRSFGDQDAALRGALVSCDEFIAAETALRQNVASARVGVVRDYDNTARLSDETAEALAQLRANLRLLPDQADRLGRIALGTSEQLGVVEQFKSRNAVLRNALAAFGLLNARLDPLNLPATQQMTVMRLGMAILELTLNTAPDVIGRVDQQLGTLSPTLFEDQSELRSLVRQAKVVRNGLPAMDAALRSLLSTPDEAEVRALRDAVLTRQAAVQATARRSRYALSGISGVLVLLLARLAFMLRARARVLRRRADFERSIADISALLSNPVGANAERQITVALAMLGEITGGDHASTVLGPGLAATYHWSRQDQADHHQWTRDVNGFMQRQPEPAASLLHIETTERGAASSLSE